MNHILLIRFSSLGDIVLTTAVCSLIKKKYPNCKISFLTAKPFDQILANHPYIDNVLSIDRKKDSIFSISKKITILNQDQKIDLLIDLHVSLRSQLLGFLLPLIKKIKINKRSFKRFLLTKFKIDLLNGEFQVDRVRNDLSPFFEKVSREELSLFMNRDNLGVTTLGSFPLKDEVKKPYILIAPDASFKPKAWPEENYNHLVTLFKDYQMIIVGNEVDPENIFKQNNINDLRGKTNLADLCSLIENSDLVICNDSAVGHIAEAYSKSVISIMGPTHESFGFALHTNKAKIFSHELKCRPCSTKGDKKCTRSEAFCFTKTKVIDVYQTAQQMLI